MFGKIISIFVIASICMQAHSQTNSIEFQDTIANQKTGAIGYKGTAGNGYVFIETPNSPDVKIYNGNIVTEGTVTAAKYYKGNVELDSVKMASLSDSTKKIPDGVVTNEKLSPELKIKDELIDSISWAKIKGKPAGFADGIDDVGGAVADSVRAAAIADSCIRIPIVTDMKIDSVSWSKIKNKPTLIDTSKIALRADSLGNQPAQKYALKTEIKNNVDSLGGIPANRYLTQYGINASVITSGTIDKRRISNDFTGKALRVDTIYAGTEPQFDEENPMLHVCPAKGSAKLRLATKGNYQSGVEFFHDGSQSWYIYNSPSSGDLNFYNNATRLSLSQQGFLGIGAPAGTYPLEVIGDIKCNNVRATGIIVNGIALNVPDYVFEDDYKLRSLEEVSEFIKENKHLPEIQSSQEIAKDGIDVVRMNLDLLKKVEELTLYIIEQDKKLEKLKSEILQIKQEK